MSKGNLPEPHLYVNLTESVYTKNYFMKKHLILFNAPNILVYLHIIKKIVNKWKVHWQSLDACHKDGSIHGHSKLSINIYTTSSDKDQICRIYSNNISYISGLKYIHHGGTSKVWMPNGWFLTMTCFLVLLFGQLLVEKGQRRIQNCINKHIRYYMEY